MSDKNTVSMKEQRQRRQRVNRIKKTIMTTIGVWMLLSMTFCIVMSVQVFRLSHRMDELAQNAVLIQQMTEESEGYRGTSHSSDIQSVNMGDSNTDSDEKENEPKNESKNESVNALPADSSVTFDETADDNQPQEGVKQKVYLTFDDGPSENTAKILDILKEKGVKATFFVIGQDDENSKALYQRIVEEGHTLGMHSYSHRYSVIYESLESFEADFNQLRTYLTEITGVEPTIMRFPGGSSNQVSNIDMREFIRFLNDEGVTYYDWNVASGDATSQVYTPDELVENVMKDIVKYDTSIVLMHDAATKATTVEALDDMIDQLLAMGVELLPIDNNTRLIQHISVDDVNNE